MKEAYSPSHEWIRVEEEVATIGITQHAQEELGEIVYVELPRVGKSVRAGEEIVVLESTKAAADIYSPVSGEIVEVNESLKSEPHRINQDAQNMGWLFRIKISNPSELDTLLTHQQYLLLVN